MAPVRITSLMAYNDLVASGKGNTQRTLILQKIMNARRPVTRTEIAFHCNIPINAVCGRVKELLDAQCIKEFDRHTCTVTGNLAYRVGPII